MSRYFINIKSTADRERARKVLDAAPFGSRFEIKAAKRSLPQNDKMWAMLTEIAQQLPWHGHKIRPDDWKLLFLNSLKRELCMMPNLDNTGFVNINQSSSDLTKSEMSDLIELMHEFGARHDIKFSDDARSNEPPI
jgi:hypothetical protein